MSVPALHAPSITKRLRRNGVDVYSHLHAPGVVRVWTIENDADAAIRRASAVLLQAGFEVAAAHGYEGALLVTLPVEEPEDDEPVIVRAGQAAPLAQQDAPRQDADGEFRYDEQGNARYWTAEEVAAERAPAVRITTREELIARQVARGVSLERATMVADARDFLQAELTRNAPAIARVLTDEPGPEVDDPREQPASVDWSEAADQLDERHPSRGERDHPCSGRYCSTCADRALQAARKVRA